MRVRDLSPELLLAWQRKLTKEGGTKRFKVRGRHAPTPGGLSPNTIRLARSPLSGAFKLAISLGMISDNPTGPGAAAPTEALDPQALVAGRGPPSSWA